MAVSPYLFFCGDCAEAFEFYHQVLGGDLLVLTNADLPEGEEPMPGGTPEQVMHAALTLPDAVIMGSDDPTGDGGPKTGVGVVYTADDAESAERIFDALSQGGVVQMPFGATFYSNGFGAFLDRFGVPWMVDTAGDVPGVSTD